MTDEERQKLVKSLRSPRPDASADRKALQSLHWHLLNRTENREVLLGIVEDALGFRSRAAAAPPRPDTSALIEAANAIEGLLSEWDKFCKYGSPMAKLANERVTYARKVLSDLRARPVDRSGK